MTAAVERTGYEASLKTNQSVIITDLVRTERELISMLDLCCAYTTCVFNLLFHSIHKTNIIALFAHVKVKKTSYQKYIKCEM